MDLSDLHTRNTDGSHSGTTGYNVDELHDRAESVRRAKRAERFYGLLLAGAVVFCLIYLWWYVL